MRVRQSGILEVSVDQGHSELFFYLLLESPQFFFNAPVDVAEAPLGVVVVELLSLFVGEGGNHFGVVALSLHFSLVA